jgi:putative lipoic acid-binding regulatory protein
MSDNNESAIQFPCDFPIKAMGLASYNLEVIVFDIVTQHAPDTSKNALKTRESSNGKYISITVTVNAQNQAQLDAIYQALTDHEHVMMAL